jgi:homocysteine S-methyltransferase
LIALQTEILGAASMNIAAILAVTGDAVKKGKEPAKSVFEGNSVKLLEIVQKMRQGKLMSGEDLEQPVDMLVGVAYNPNAADINNETEKLLRKIEAGADFAETQPVHSKDAFNRCVDALAKYNIPQERFPVIFGLMPVMSRRNGEFLNKFFSGIHIPEEVLKEFDSVEKKEDREKIAYEQTLELAMHFSKDGTNNYYVICPFSKFELVGKIVEYVKFGYSHVSFRDQVFLRQDMSRQVETPARVQGTLAALKSNH